MSREQDEFVAAALDDLAARADAVLGQELLLEVADQARAEYASVTLASRLMAAVGTEVCLSVAGVGAVSGRLDRCASTWCAVAATGRGWVVPLPHVQVADGLGPRAVPESAWPATTRLGLGSVLRRLADEAERTVVHLLDGSTTEGRVGRVGADFVELLPGPRRQPRLVAQAAVAAVMHEP